MFIRQIRMIATFLLTALIAAASPAAAGPAPSSPPPEQGRVASPLYAGWANLKPGSSVSYVVELVHGDKAMTNRVTNRLVSVAPDAAVIESTGQMAGPDGKVIDLPPTRTTLPASVPAGTERMPPGMTGTTTDAGAETIDVAGRKVACTVHAFSGAKAGQEASGKTWYSPEVPGGVARLEVVSKAAHGENTMRMTVVAFEKKE